MFPLLNKHQAIQVFNRLGFWSIPLLSVLLFLPLALAKSISLSLQPDSASKNSSGQQLSQDFSAAWQWHRQLVSLSLVARESNPLKTNNAKIHSSQPHKQRNVAKAPALEMAVAIANDASSLAIATSTPGEALDDTGHILRTIPAGQTIYAQPTGQSIDLNSWQAPPSIWIKATRGGYVYAGEHWYRGRIRLIFQGNSLLVINHVDLEEYLYSVVGSEMPSYWSPSALKAQAIAARSYALARYVQPVSPFYQIGSDEAWQVYKGLDGETSSTREAVSQTTGQFLSYQGGVVDSLYAATDDIVIQAHGGLGMSQTGAQALATQGYDYLHILGTYYPGTALARLQLGKSADPD